jgi:DNA-binding MarR family transcriptional regulator
MPQTKIDTQKLERLQSLGITKAEATVYLIVHARKRLPTVLELETAAARHGINRKTVGRAVTKLLKLNFIEKNFRVQDSTYDDAPILEHMDQAREDVQQLWTGKTVQRTHEELPIEQTFSYTIRPVAKTKTGLIARARIQSVDGPRVGWHKHLNGWLFVFYPKPEHAEAFASSIGATALHGPNHLFPGSVGVMGGVAKRDKSVEIDLSQGSFIEGATALLTKKVAKKYGGWQRALMHHTLSFAHTMKRPHVFFHEKYRKHWNTMQEAGEHHSYGLTTDHELSRRYLVLQHKPKRKRK